MQAKDETQFAQTLRETMDTVGVEEAEPEGGTPPRWRPGWAELAGLVGGSCWPWP